MARGGGGQGPAGVQGAGTYAVTASGVSSRGTARTGRKARSRKQHEDSDMLIDPLGLSWSKEKAECKSSKHSSLIRPRGSRAWTRVPHGPCASVRCPLTPVILVPDRDADTCVCFHTHLLSHTLTVLLVHLGAVSHHGHVLPHTRETLAPLLFYYSFLENPALCLTCCDPTLTTVSGENTEPYYWFHFKLMITHPTGPFIQPEGRAAFPLPTRSLLSQCPLPVCVSSNL